MAKIYQYGKSYGGSGTIQDISVDGTKIINPELILTSKYDLGEEISTLPYDACRGKAVVLNGCIYLLTTFATQEVENAFYKWDGMTWEYVSDLPYPASDAAVVV